MKDWHDTKVSVTPQHRPRAGGGGGEGEKDAGEEMKRGDVLRERVNLSVSAVCHFRGTLIPLLFISKCQETIFRFDLAGSTLWR